MDRETIEPMGEDSAARAGGEASGGTDPRPGDAATPDEADAGQQPSSEAMRRAGFGDHKGTRI